MKYTTGDRLITEDDRIIEVLDAIGTVEGQDVVYRVIDTDGVVVLSRESDLDLISEPLFPLLNGGDDLTDEQLAEIYEEFDDSDYPELGYGDGEI